MPRVESREQLAASRDQLRDARTARQADHPRVLIGMGTCGIAAGAREVMDAVRLELARQSIEAEVVAVGCIGICEMEPLVDIQEPGLARVTYHNVMPAMVPRLIEEHLVRRRVMPEWAIGRLSPDGIAPPDGTEAPPDGTEAPPDGTKAPPDGTKAREEAAA